MCMCGVCIGVCVQSVCMYMVCIGVLCGGYMYVVCIGAFVWRGACVVVGIGV